MDYRITSGIEVAIQALNKFKKSPTTMSNFSNANPDLITNMDSIKRHMDSALKRETPITKEEIREIIASVVYAEAREVQKKVEAKRMTSRRRDMSSIPSASA